VIEDADDWNFDNEDGQSEHKSNEKDDSQDEGGLTSLTAEATPNSMTPEEKADKLV
jgi:hypothetical protein